MILPRNGRRYTSIGISVTQSAIDAVQFAIEDTRLELHAHASKVLTGREGPAEIANVLKGTIATAPFVGRNVVSAMLNSRVDFRKVTLPAGIAPGSGPEFDDAFALEASSCLPYSVAGAVLDWLPLGSDIVDGAECATVLLTASKCEDVNLHLALLRAAGLHCVSLDTAPCAVTRLLSHDDQLRAIISLDCNETDICIAQAGRPVFCRTIKLGAQAMVERLASELNLSEAEAHHALSRHGVRPEGDVSVNLKEAAETGLASADIFPSVLFDACSAVFQQFQRELKRTLSYFSDHLRGGDITQAHLLGSFVPAGLDTWLSHELGTPIHSERDFVVQAKEFSLSFDEPLSIVAAGLALREEIE